MIAVLKKLTILVRYHPLISSLLTVVLFGFMSTSSWKIPETSQQLDVDNGFTVVSYNIKHGRGMDDNIDLKRIADVILETGADIVALQEVDIGVERSGRRDIVCELSELTGLKYQAFGKNLDHQGGDYGNATLSRYPITEYENVQFEQLGPELRGILSTVIEIQDRSLLLLNTHLDFRSDDDSERLLYIQGARNEIIPKYNVDAVIFGGDFNDTLGSLTYQNVTEFLVDAWEESGDGDGFTIPSNDPEKRIDYIFYSGNINPVNAWNPGTQASDHLPVAVEFVWKF